jgi:hypothetical protein
MPRLYCEEHGRDQEARSESEHESYRMLGETVLIVTGPLKTPSWRCDRCYARLKKGTRAYLVTAFPHQFAEDLDRYDYAYERQYFLLEKAEIKVYGAGVPGGMRSPASVLEAH